MKVRSNTKRRTPYALLRTLGDRRSRREYRSIAYQIEAVRSSRNIVVHGCVLLYVASGHFTNLSVEWLQWFHTTKVPSADVTLDYTQRENVGQWP